VSGARERGARADAAGEREPRWPGIVAPAAIGLAGIAAWELAVRALAVPVYLVPAPSAVAAALAADAAGLGAAALVTVRIAALALASAVALGVALAVLFSLSRWVERAFFPWAVVLQVTPIVAIAPLVIVWTRDDATLALLICAWIVAFFPILSNTALGLRSADRNLVDLFRLCRATRWQELTRLRLPAALPYFLGGLRISGGLALIGAIVAEFVAGSGGAALGLGTLILEAGYRLQIARMFAALFLITASGVAIFALLTLVQHLALRRWHESALERDG
jgi:NitT/TauT family transport system permease protein